MDFSVLQDKGWIEFNTATTNPDLIVTALQETFKVTLEKVTILEPKKHSTNARTTLSGTFGYHSFPFHTDAANLFIPPRFFSLRYMGKTSSGTATLLIDGKMVEQDSEAETFLNETYLVKGDAGTFYTPILNSTTIRGMSIFRYNALVMKRAISSKKPSFANLLQRFIPKRIIWHADKMVIIDNWRILHGREALPESEREIRRLERLFFVTG